MSSGKQEERHALPEPMARKAKKPFQEGSGPGSMAGIGVFSLQANPAGACAGR
jgi:hypothetical protein